MIHLLYSLFGAMIENEDRHAQVVIKELGITYEHAIPQPIVDQWLFINCKNVPEELPGYIGVIKPKKSNV